MSQNTRLDCVIVGHNDVDFSVVEEDLKKTQNYSGAYRDLKANSVNFHGERITYMDLLNRSLRAAKGKDYGLHMCELPHLGAAYLKSFLAKRNLNVEIVNSFNSGRERLKQLLDERPNAVAITTTLYVEHMPIVEIVEFIRRHNSETKIIVGGPHIFNLCSNQEPEALDYIFKLIGADIYIFDSQGERTLSLILEELRDSKNPDLSRIPNLYYQPDGKVFAQTKRVVEDNDMDENSVEWNHFERDFYTPSVQMRTARSCAFACAFCKYPTIAGPLNLTSIPVIEHELKMLEEGGVKNVVFIDDTFNVPLPRFKDICRMMIRNQFSFNWFSFFRCSNSDDEAFDLMQQSGCKGVFLGVESGDPSILEAMNKFAKVDKYKAGIGKLKARGIATFASIIVGYPGETEATVQNTIDFLQEAAPTFYRAELYYHYTDVPIHQKADQYGLRGAGYSWKHNTMTWREASELVKVIYRTVKGPRVLPGYMFDFWSIPYLMGRGFTLEHITGFTEIAQEILVNSFDETIPETAAQEQRLTELFQTL